MQNLELSKIEDIGCVVLVCAISLHSLRFYVNQYW
jgi:hypothetical protein